MTTNHKTAAADGDLRAWWSGYDVVAATSEAEARGVITQSTGLDGEEADGEGWQVLPSDTQLMSERGAPLGETVGDAVSAAGKPSYLWATES